MVPIHSIAVLGAGPSTVVRTMVCINALGRWAGLGSGRFTKSSSNSKGVALATVKASKHGHQTHKLSLELWGVHTTSRPIIIPIPSLPPPADPGCHNCLRAIIKQMGHDKRRKFPLEGTNLNVLRGRCICRSRYPSFSVGESQAPFVVITNQLQVYLSGSDSCGLSGSLPCMHEIFRFDISGPCAHSGKDEKVIPTVQVLSTRERILPLF